MPGLRERKKKATRAAIHAAAMRLFEERGFAATTVDRIAEEAGVSRATVFTYFPTKEDIVFGDAPEALDALAAALRERPAGTSAVTVVRGWLGQLAGWLEPDVILQLRLAREVPGVGARRLQLYREAQRVIADELAAEAGDSPLAPQLAAAALVASLSVVEERAAASMQEEGRSLTPEEIDALFENAVAFAEAGISALRTAPPVA